MKAAQGQSIGFANCRSRWFFLLLTMIYIFPVTSAGSEALNSGRALADLEIRSKGAYETVLLMPSEFEPEKWYYATSKLHFGKREISGQDVPEMTLLRYQRPDPNNPHKYIEGATLQLAVDLDPLDDAAKRGLLSKARSAAEKWESSHHKEFSAKVEEQAAKTGSEQERWKALYTSYMDARKKDLTARNSKNIDSVLEQTLTDGLDDWAINGLDESARLLKMRNPNSLAALPTVSAQLSLYDGIGQAVQTVGPTRGAAPEYATEKLTFTVELGQNSVDTSEALLSSQTGIYLILRRQYEVLSEPLPYKIIIDYDKAVREYRSNSNFLSQAVLFASFQLPEFAEAEKKTLVARFERDILKASDRDGNAVPLESIDTKTLQALVGRINREVLRDDWAPDKVNIRTLSSSKKSQAVDLNDLSTLKVRDVGPASDEKEDKPAVSLNDRPPEAPARGGTETLLPGYRYRERNTVITQGFLTVAGYSQSIKDQLIFDEPTPEWQNAYFLLPGVGDDPQIGVRKVVTEIVLQIKGRSWREQTATWEIGKGWTLADGETPTSWGIISFPLAEARKEYGEPELQKSEFHINQVIRCALGKIYTLSSSYAVKVFDGKSMIAAPLECIQPVIFDFSNLHWNTSGQALYSSQITVTQKLGSGRPLVLLRNVFPGRELMVAPMSIDPMGELDVGLISAKVGFDARYRDDQGRPRRKALWWKLNDTNLVDLYPALFISIFNGDWKN